MLLGCQPRDIPDASLSGAGHRAQLGSPGARIPWEMCAKWDRQIYRIAELSASWLLRVPWVTVLLPSVLQDFLGWGETGMNFSVMGGGLSVPLGCRRVTEGI